MAWPEPSSIQGGPNPKDQQEEREARIAEIQERIRRHQDQADSHQEQADQHQREADRLLESVKRGQAEEPPSRFVEHRKKPRP
jgi:hypothetical protein